MCSEPRMAEVGTGREDPRAVAQETGQAGLPRRSGRAREQKVVEKKERALESPLRARRECVWVR